MICSIQSKTENFSFKEQEEKGCSYHQSGINCYYLPIRVGETAKSAEGNGR
jgi:hypothetical protein